MVFSAAALRATSLFRRGLPFVVLVACALDRGYLLVRAGRGWLAQATFTPGIVAFQTASSSFNQDWRWEVVVQGRAEVLSQAPVPDVPPSPPLIANEMTTVLGISMETGRQRRAPPNKTSSQDVFSINTQ